jgi:preprotein translocase subunit SecE
MAKIEARGAKKDNVVISYLKETRAELRKVHWPSQQEARMLTLIVLAVTITMAAFLGILDYVFDRLVAGVIKLNPIALTVSVLMVVGLFVAGYFVTREE